MCTACELFVEFTFQKGGENSVEAFQSSDKLSSSRTHDICRNGASRNPGDRLITISDALMRIRRMSGENAHIRYKAHTEMAYASRQVASQHVIMLSAFSNLKHLGGGPTNSGVACNDFYYSQIWKSI